MILYRKIDKYKYQLTETYICQTGIKCAEYIREPPADHRIELSPSGMLSISKGYAWDGPSGPSLDTKNFLRGSLVHDALYQLMRTKRISLEERLKADKLLREHCVQDGMSSVRAWYVYRAVRMFGKGSAKPQPEERYMVETAP